MSKLKLSIDFKRIPVTNNFNRLPILITYNIKVTLIFFIKLGITKYFQPINNRHSYLKPTNYINIKFC